ncbi:MAG: UDP-N-acetylglucosamine 1-carboxyvinyltransferase [Candidatus Sumerlaeia bacterium]|nr:UDP-N-acetylglucosamine 1-carboxyvinyltransferase [Candidatus Sumerlaeia bacterium]
MDQIRVTGGKALRGEVKISGSKNATLPIMAAALLAEKPVTLTNTPLLQDVRTMAAVLQILGVKVTLKDRSVLIDAKDFSAAEIPYDVVRKMRASVYVLGPMLARLGQARVSLPGGCAIGPRPIDLHIKGLRALGADIQLEHGYIEASARKGLRGAEMWLEGPNGSSVGATCNVMMAAVMAKGTTVIHAAAREPEVCDTAEFLKSLGARIEGAGSSTITIEGVDRLDGGKYRVVADRIEAGTYLVAGAMTGGDVKVSDCRPDHLETVIEKLAEVGADLSVDGTTIRVRGGNLSHPIAIRTLPYPGFPTDMQAQFTSMLAVVPGTSTVTDTIYPDRFIHVAELNRMGADIHAHAGVATIKGVKLLSAAPVMASDLRASAALVLAGLIAKGTTTVLRVYHIDRGYESIEKKLSALGAQIERISKGQ